MEYRNSISRHPKPSFCSATTVVPLSTPSVILHDWWLDWPSSGSAAKGQGLAVAGFTSLEGKLRAFHSAKISKRNETTILEAKDGISITLIGLLNRSRTHENGIPPEVYNHFLLGFPFNWEEYASIRTRSSGNKQMSETSHLPSSLDHLSVTSIRDLLISTSGEPANHSLIKNLNLESITPTRDAKSVPKDWRCKDGGGVSTRSMTRLKKNLRKKEEDLSSDVSKRSRTENRY